MHSEQNKYTTPIIYFEKNNAAKTKMKIKNVRDSKKNKEI